MAKKKSVSTEDLLFAGLKNALDEQPHPLTGTGPSGALFTAAQKALAQQAVTDGYVEHCDVPAGVKKSAKTPQYVRLAERGRQLLIGRESPKAVLEALQPLVQSLATQVGELSSALQRTLALIERVLATKSAPRPEPTGHEPAPAPVPVQPTSPPLETALHQAYEKLRWNVEYRDGLVALPHLYHEVRKTLPQLTVEEFHRKLTQLWDSRQVELHILNEVRTAREPEKAITRNDRLYYFLFWKSS